MIPVAPLENHLSQEEPQYYVYIETFGCQMNVLDSELVTEALALHGYRITEHQEHAHIVLLNTCSVRALSEQKVWSKLGRLKKQKAQRFLLIGVLGCMAERCGEEIRQRFPEVDLVCGPSRLQQVPNLLDHILTQQTAVLALSGHPQRLKKAAYNPAVLDGGEDLEWLDLARIQRPKTQTAQAYVRITRGCNKFCSFCVVPYTRGPEVHRAPQAICDEIKHLVAMGALEITLLGQTVNHYTYVDGGKRVDFADLLQFLHDAVPDLPRLRFITSYPRDFTDAALDVMAACPRICSYLHIPAQSGSNAVLRRMNRGYTIEQYLDLIDRARSRMPDIALAGDMITGFIGETDEDHQLSVEFLKKVRYKSCFIFKYSPREGTVAARRWQDDIPERIKQERHQELLDTQHEISLAHHQRYVGQILSILVERENPLKATPDEGAAAVAHEHLRLYTEKTPARLIGRTMRDEMVVTQGPVDWIGKIITVKATKATALTVFAEPMEG